MISKLIAPCGLPADAYFEPSYFQQENRYLWRQTWQCVGRESDISEPNQFFTCTVAQQPVVVLRTVTRQLRAFHNVCPHRGAQLLDGQGSCTKIRCPYHGWLFDHHGQLNAVPRASCFPNLSQQPPALTPVSVETWGGFIFVKLVPGGEPLMQYLGRFAQYLEQYEQDWSSLVCVDRWHYVLPVNWKFLVENYLESYHLSCVHADSLKCFDPLKICAAPNGLHYQIEVPFRPGDIAQKHNTFAGNANTVSWQGLIFPNLMVNPARDNVSVFQVLPQAAAETRFEVSIYQSPAQQKLWNYEPSYRANLDRVVREDFQAVERLQRGVRSDAYKVRHLATPLEDGIRHFHQVCTTFMERIHEAN